MFVILIFLPDVFKDPLLLLLECEADPVGEGASRLLDEILEGLFLKPPDDDVILVTDSARDGTREMGFDGGVILY